MFVPLSSCTIAAPSMSNSINFNGYFPCSPLAASLVSDHIPWKCGIWKHEDFIINIHSLLTSNVFLVISIHIQSCGSDFWKYLLLISPSNSPKLTGLSTFAQSAHNPLNHSNQNNLYGLLIIRTGYQMLVLDKSWLQESPPHWFLAFPLMNMLVSTQQKCMWNKR